MGDGHWYCGGICFRRLAAQSFRSLLRVTSLSPLSLPLFCFVFFLLFSQFAFFFVFLGVLKTKILKILKKITPHEVLFPLPLGFSSCVRCFHVENLKIQKKISSWGVLSVLRRLFFVIALIFNRLAFLALCSHAFLLSVPRGSLLYANRPQIGISNVSARHMVVSAVSDPREYFPVYFMCETDF